LHVVDGGQGGEYHGEDPKLDVTNWHIPGSSAKVEVAVDKTTTKAANTFLLITILLSLT